MNAHFKKNLGIYKLFQMDSKNFKAAPGSDHDWPLNSTVDFIPTDTEEHWLKNQQIQTDTKSVNYYLDNPIEYRINNHGYRTDYNFKEGDEVNVFLGCSHTFGIGHHLENTWSHIVNEKIGGNFVNLALGAVGIENQFRQLMRWSDFFKIKNIFHYQPLYAREELLYDDHTSTNIKVGNMDSPKFNDVEKDWVLYTFGQDAYIYRKYLTNILAIEMLANNFGANYYFHHKYLKFSKSELENSILARDFSHHPVIQQSKLADIFLLKKENNDTSISLENYPNK